MLTEISRLIKVTSRAYRAVEQHCWLAMGRSMDLEDSELQSLTSDTLVQY